jgi:hypothetical protein
MAKAKKAKAKPKKAKTSKPTKRGARKAPRLAFRGKAKPKKKPRPSPNVSASASETIGTVTVPSGTMAVFDIGLVGHLPMAALEPALVKVSAPSDRPLEVVGVRVGKGRFADCWDYVAVELGAGEVTSTRKLGEAGVDFARLVCMDRGALDHWQHEDSLDGLADFVFWGRDAGELAKAMRAPVTSEGHGWIDLTVAEAEAKADQAARLKSEHHWLLATDFRPHSHHFRALAAARKSRNGAGTIDVGGAQICLFFTSWGDGVFPVFLDLDEHDHPVRVRIQLATDASDAALRAVN